MAPVQTRYIHEEPGKLFDKTVLLLKDVISEIFWVQLFDRDSQEALPGLLVGGCKPSPCISTVCDFTVTHLCRVPCSLQVLMEMLGHLRSCCRARNLRNSNSVALRASQN